MMNSLRGMVGRCRSAVSHVVAIEQLDRHPLRTADETDAHARPHGGRLLGELDAFSLELGCERIDAAYHQPEMIEALIGRPRRRIAAVASRHRGNEDIGAAELEVNTLPPLRGTAQHFGTKHA